ncbi:MAG: hypothetical protein E6H04_10735 [Bacillati bacterium ANGP1]|uniref:HdeD family acid-resistance protein n=1 Tax=Candidatus Segetimicrobium genomatis TaxID=2569760 RepID=A0A537J7J0_9BACT|nr:MAG: hypothetical protein E6H04_10735 [Terrabacteria group bacterium ANGP1]
MRSTRLRPTSLGGPSSWSGSWALAPDCSPLLLIIAYWSIFRGLLEIVAAVRLRHEVPDEGWLIIGGIASVVFGALLLIFPIPGVLAVIWFIGVYAIFAGFTQVMLGVRLKGFEGQSQAAR